MKYSLYILLFFCAIGCDSSSPGDKKHYTNLNIKEDILYVNIKIDTSCFNFVFDTGCLIGCLIPDSTAKRAVSNRSINYSNGIGTIVVDSILVGGFPYNSTEINIVNAPLPPIIAPNYASDNRIWHFNLDSLVLSIDNSIRDSSGGVFYPLIFTKRQGKRNAPMVNIPIIFSQGGISLKTDYYYLLDTGTPNGFAMTDPPKEMREFVSKIKHTSYMDEISLERPDRELIQFNIDLKIHDMLINDIKCVFDTGLRSIDTQFGKEFAHAGKPLVGTIGMRFLKFFNFDIDLRNQRLILYKNSSEFPSKTQNINHFWCDDSGKVTRIGIESKAYKMGLRIGDKINAINNIKFLEIQKNVRDSLIYNGSSITLLVNDTSHISLSL